MTDKGSKNKNQLSQNTESHVHGYAWHKTQKTIIKKHTIQSKTQRL